MFTYLHCYMPETWDAQVKAGFVRPQDGIRFVESIELEDKYKFNNLAHKNGDLYNIVKERKCPFYIDRLQGGCYIENYDYDKELINDYRSMLGDKFWGFQMHEWMSNITSDLHKLSSNGCSSWTEEEITKTIFKAYPFTHLFLECMNARELAEAGCPQTSEEFIKLATDLFIKRQKYTDDMLLTCDSAYLAYQLELKHKTKRIMPEIGAQTYDSRIQVAYARGMAKAYGIPFGTYYEPWGGDPFSACNYQKDGLNEWNSDDNDTPYQTAGGNGGSSRSLQRREHLYSYMAGAEFMAEEWGMSNTFYDWVDFEITPYGKVKLDFLRFTEKYPNIGKLLTPIAVVLPAELPVLENIYQDNPTFVGFPVEGPFADKLLNARKGIRKLFADSYPMRGSDMEIHSLKNCITPDAMDIVNADIINVDNYQYIVDLSGDPGFASKHQDKIISVDEVIDKLKELLPLEMDGKALKLITKVNDNTHYLMLLNNSGVLRTVADGESLIEEEKCTVNIKVKSSDILEQCEGDAIIKSCYNGNYEIEVPAGGWFFGKF